MHSDHLGSSRLMSDNLGAVKVGSTTRFLPYGGYRTTPTTGITDRGFTGHQMQDELGLVYMRARWFVPGVGRFASADTIVPDPKDPQAHNRFSYTLNNPLRYTDPTGHYTFEDDPSEPDYSAMPLPPPVPFTLFEGLPVANPELGNGFGATAFARNYAAELYSETSGLHGGIDLAGESGQDVFAQVRGVVLEINIVSGDAEPNIVVQVGKYRITFGHTDNTYGWKRGDVVGPNDVIGTLQAQIWKNPDGTEVDNSHLHLVVQGGDGRVYNPADFFNRADIADVPWSSYVEGEGLYSMSSFLYTTTNYWTAADKTPIGVIR